MSSMHLLWRAEFTYMFVYMNFKPIPSFKKLTGEDALLQGKVDMTLTNSILS